MYEDEKNTPEQPNEGMTGGAGETNTETVGTTETTAERTEVSAAGTENTAETAEHTSSQYRYSGPFYQDSDYQRTENTGRTYEEPERDRKAPKKKKKKGFVRVIAKAVCVALVFGVVAGAAFCGTNLAGQKLFGDKVAAPESQTTEDTTKKDTTTDTGSKKSQSAGSASEDSTASVADIVQECMPSLVAITNVSVKEVQNYWGFGWYSQPQQQEETSTGTGIIIGENDSELLIVTNNHVTTGATNLSVVFSVDEGNENATPVEAQIKGSDSEKDVSVIAVQLSDIPEETLSQIKTATIGDSSEVQVGDQVIAIGNALGYGQSVTKGIISALNREVSLQNDDGSTISNKLIQTDAAINPGNSGGALLNMKGEVIGINEAKLSSNYIEGMGYAIPISDVEGIIGDLQNLKTRSEVDSESMGYLGITCQDVTSDVAEQYDMPEGIYIKSVVSGCAADKAGLTKGDILTKFDSMSVTSYDALRERLKYYEAGETVEVTVQTPENGSYVEKTVTLTLSTKAEVEAANQ